MSTKVAQAGVNAGVKAGINSAVYGTSFKDGFRSALATEVSNASFEYVGDTSMWKNYLDGSLEKTLLHSVVGGASAELMGGDFASGAAAAGFNELLSPYTDIDAKKAGMSQERADAIEQAISGFIGGVAAGAVGGEDQANIGSTIAKSATEFNRQLHEKEIELIKSISKQYAEDNGISEEKAEQMFTMVAKGLVDEKSNEATSMASYLEKYVINNGKQVFDFGTSSASDVKEYLIKASDGLYYVDYNNKTINQVFSADSAEYKSQVYNPNYDPIYADAAFSLLTTVGGLSKVKAISNISWGVSLINDAQSGLEKNDWTRVAPDFISPPWSENTKAKFIGTSGSLINIWRDYEDNNKINKELENQVKDLEKINHE